MLSKEIPLSTPHGGPTATDSWMLLASYRKLPETILI
jgi:hypothetical protein